MARNVLEGPRDAAGPPDGSGRCAAMILVIDNYDSFTYNLVQYLGELGQDPEVHRNDKIQISEIESRNPDRIVISPGPGTPDQAGITLKLIKYFQAKKPILGVCLGQQAIGKFLEVMTASPIYSETLKKLQARIDLEVDEADSLLQAILQQQFSEIQVAGLLVTLASKGESISEIAGFAQAMRRCATKFD